MRREAIVACVALLATTGCADDGTPVENTTITASAGVTDEPTEEPSEASTPSDPSVGATTEMAPAVPRVVGTVAEGLVAPWGIDFLPDGSAVVTERDTRRVLRVTEAGDVSEIGVVDEAAPQGEGGLLGVAVSPTYESDSTLFFYLTTATDNRVVRTTYDGPADGAGEGLGALEVILDGIPNGFIHDGGRLEFGPDGDLYVSTGETGEPTLAQDRDSLGGKILRITPDGAPSPDNPDSSSPVWTWGHRNVQGLAFDDEGELWASEFGASTWDELNRIEKGQNYGWPEVEGRGGRSEYADPEVVWNTADASPSGLAFLDGDVWMAGLRGERLWRVDVSSGRARDPRDFFVGAYGRMRSVAVAPDGNLWVTTSNRDGRGDPAAADDRILVVDVS